MRAAPLIEREAPLRVAVLRMGGEDVGALDLAEFNRAEVAVTGGTDTGPGVLA